MSLRAALLRRRYTHAAPRASDPRCRDILANNAGARACRVHPKTDAPITVYKSRDAGIDSDSPWATVCEKHGSMIVSATLALARLAMLAPDWCEDCAALL